MKSQTSPLPYEHDEKVKKWKQKNDAKETKQIVEKKKTARSESERWLKEELKEWEGKQGESRKKLQKKMKRMKSVDDDASGQKDEERLMMERKSQTC